MLNQPHAVFRQEEFVSVPEHFSGHDPEHIGVLVGSFSPAYIECCANVSRQVNIQARHGEEALRVYAWDRVCACSVIESFGRLSFFEFNVNINGMSLICADIFPVLAEGVTSLAVIGDNVSESLKVNRAGFADALYEVADFCPAVRVESYPGFFGVMPE